MTLLKRICAHNPKFLDNVDFICGTSAGGLLALLLASGYSPEECDEIYGFSAPHIFGHNPSRAINPFRSKYSDKAKQEIMQYYYGGRTMGDLQKTCAVIAFRLDGRKSHTHMMFNKEGWRPAVFSNMPQEDSLILPDVDLPVRPYTHYYHYLPSFDFYTFTSGVGRGNAHFCCTHLLSSVPWLHRWRACGEQPHHRGCFQGDGALPSRQPQEHRSAFSR